MQGKAPTRNFAARAGHWSARHRKTAIFGWIGFVLVTLVIGMGAGMKTIENDSGPGEAGRAGEATERAFPQKVEEQVLVQKRDAEVTQREFEAGIAETVTTLESTEHVRDVRSPLDRGNSGQLAPDGHSALVAFELAGSEEQIDKSVEAPLAAVAALAKSHPELRIEQFGAASMDVALSESSEKDLHRAETLSLPITILILVVAFGALVAAGIPVILSLSAVAATMGLVNLVSQVMPVNESVGSVLLLIGLAVGVDYSLFYIRREREERAAGRSPREALDVAAATSGRAVLISGFTVMIAMAGMYLAGDPTFISFGTGTILVVAVAMIGSLTVLPAILSALGDKVERGRVPFLRRKRDGGQSRLWSALIDRVMRRPKLAVVLSAGLLVALTIPALGMKTELPGFNGISRDIPAMQTYDRIQAAFPGGPAPAEVVVTADDVTAGPVQRSIERLKDQALATGAANAPVSTMVSEDRSTAIVSLPLDGDGTDGRSQRALTQLREEIVPATTGNVDGVDTNVGGMAAATRDFNQLLGNRLPLVFAFVLSLAFLLMLTTFRSIVIPIKAIVLNLLSVGAAYGILTLVFQDGLGESVLGFESTGAITSWLPLFLFVILFGLSMDYHVFILSRIREAVDRGMSTESAVAHGIKSTAGVVTSAAVVMVAVFSIFATLSSIEMKQMGVGLAAAVLIDATLVRGVLLPASMKLLGRWNWYLPERLGWLPETREPEVEPART
jgi:RND superfamily putative drug exporter